MSSAITTISEPDQPGAPCGAVNEEHPSPPVVFRRFSDPEDYVASLSLGAARFQTRVTSRYSAYMMCAEFHDFVFRQGWASVAATVHGQIAGNCVFLLETIPGPDRIVSGRVTPFGTLYHPASNDGYVSQSNGTASAWVSLVIPYQAFSAISVALSGRDLAPPQASALFAHTPEPARRRLIRLSSRIARIAEHDPGRLGRVATRTVLSGLLGQALTACVLNGRLEPDLAAAGRRRRIMARLEDIGEAHAHEPLTLAELCAALGVNARTLRLITHEFVGMGPTQYLRMHRLNRVRRSLAAADPRTALVGDIAGAHGFWESGRFAAIYRATFGETPLETLRRV